MPFRVSGGRACGPGIFDMKAGIALALFAVDALQRSRFWSPQERARAWPDSPGKRLVFFWNSDEEIGSDTLAETRNGAQRCQTTAVLVPEPSFGLEKGS